MANFEHSFDLPASAAIGLAGSISASQTGQTSFHRNSRRQVRFAENWPSGLEFGCRLAWSPWYTECYVSRSPSRLPKEVRSVRVATRAGGPPYIAQKLIFLLLQAGSTLFCGGICQPVLIARYQTVVAQEATMPFRWTQQESRAGGGIAVTWHKFRMAPALCHLALWRLLSVVRCRVCRFSVLA